MVAAFRPRRAATAATMVAVLALGAPWLQAQTPDGLAGRPLVDALRALQAEGLRIIFSSAIVTPDLRVHNAPRARSARQRLDELLAPHALAVRDGPGGTLQVIRIARPGRDRNDKDKATNGAGAARPAARPRATDSTGALREYVIVNEAALYPDGRSAGAAMSVARDELKQLHGPLAEDPLRLVHALPGVWAADDFKADFSVRGSAFRHVGVVIDGVSTSRLLHVAPGRGASGSLGMLAGQVLESVTLQAGAYPRRYADTLGAQLEMTLREGSRAGFRLRGALGGTSALLVGEGPLGKAASGSWLAAARRSYVEWPAAQAGSQRAPFGFSDVVANVVYDVSPGQRLSVSVVDGLSTVDGEDTLEGSEGRDGTSRVSLANVAWRSTVGGSLVLTQRASLVRQRSFDEREAGLESSERYDEMVYRATVLRPVARGLFEMGAQVTRADFDRGSGPASAIPVAGSAWTRSAYAHVTWPLTSNLRVSPGVRVTGSSLAQGVAISRWLLADWEFRTGWTAQASAGVSHQLPALTGALVTPGGRARLERARHVDLGVAHRISESIRWGVTVFDRREHDILQVPPVYPRLESDRGLPLPSADAAAWLVNGSSRGLEVVIDRRRQDGFFGWAAYSYGRARQTDVERAETFWADADRRHALSLSGGYRFSDRTAVGATVRAGGNVPVPGYLTYRSGRLFAASQRNHVRLPAYARLDVRGHRGFGMLGLQTIAFVELTNALNRRNLGVGAGTIDAATGEATGFTEALAARRATAGIAVEF